MKKTFLFTYYGYDEIETMKITADNALLAMTEFAAGENIGNFISLIILYEVTSPATDNQ